MHKMENRFVQSNFVRVRLQHFAQRRPEAATRLGRRRQRRSDCDLAGSGPLLTRRLRRRTTHTNNFNILTLPPKSRRQLWPYICHVCVAGEPVN